MKKIVVSVMTACMIFSASAAVASAAPTEHHVKAKEHKAHKAHMKAHKAKAHAHHKKSEKHRIHSKSVKPRALPKSGYGGVSE